MKFKTKDIISKIKLTILPIVLKIASIIGEIESHIALQILLIYLQINSQI